MEFEVNTKEKVRWLFIGIIICGASYIYYLTELPLGEQIWSARQKKKDQQFVPSLKDSFHPDYFSKTLSG